MADLALITGDTFVGTMTFNEPTPPDDGALTSDNPTFVTVSLGADHVTYTGHCVGAPADGSASIVTLTYTGTSVSPGVGPAVVPMGTVSVTQAPMAEMGNLNLGSATVTHGGP